MKDEDTIIAVNGLFNAINVLKKNIDMVNKKPNASETFVRNEAFQKLTHSYNKIVESLEKELRMVSNFSLWIHVDYLAPYFDHEEMAKRAKANMECGETGLNRLHLCEDEFSDFCNDAWHKLTDKNQDGLFMDPELKEWYKLFPDSLVIFQKDDNHDEYKENAELESDLAWKKMIKDHPKFADHDRYYYIGNEAVGARYPFMF